MSSSSSSHDDEDGMALVAAVAASSIAMRDNRRNFIAAFLFIVDYITLRLDVMVQV